MGIESSIRNHSLRPCSGHVYNSASESMGPCRREANNQSLPGGHSVKSPLRKFIDSKNSAWLTVGKRRGGTLTSALYF
jgi:hypothetical protein